MRHICEMTEFTPQNELEQQLQQAQNGQLAPERFFQTLLAAPLYMPMEGRAPGQPLMVEDEEGTRVLMLFTSPERARPFIADYPEYAETGVQEALPAILARLGAEVGVSLNPGAPLGFDLGPEQVRELLPETPE